MPETTNYHLYLTDDETTRFLDWRNAINGTSDSNMIKIDDALDTKADNSICIEATLYADQWEQSGSIFVQDIEIDGLTAEQNGVAGTALNLSEEQLEAVRSAGLFIQQQSGGVLTIGLADDLPGCDIPILIILLG